ncbi:MAG: hypothetical protein QM820_19360 [Minicystis sp.]
MGRPFVQWLVVECSAVGQKFGGPQALPPRRDVAYFVDEETAERDAKAFAEFRSCMTSGDATALIQEAREASSYSRRHAAFPWDHNLFNPLIGWAVLEWEGDDTAGGERRDVAYFLDPESAELDARVFRLIRDRLDAKTHAEANHAATPAAAAYRS